MNRDKVLPAGAVLVFLLCSCVRVTTYGLGPDETGPGQFRFKLYYNADASEVDIDNKAAELVEDIRLKGKFETCRFERGAMASPIRVKEVEVRVSCEAAGAL